MKINAFVVFTKQQIFSTTHIFFSTGHINIHIIKLNYLIQARKLEQFNTKQSKSKQQTENYILYIKLC